jgi:hypothetical protein
MNKLLIACTALFTIALLTGCRSKKGITTASDTLKVAPADKSKAAFFDAFAKNYNTFSYYESSGSMEYATEGSKMELSVAIVMEKDRYIMLTITALLGIEAARVLITQDSISILNRLQREHIVTNFDYIANLANVKLDLRQLQSMIAGNPPFVPDLAKAYPDTMLQYIVFSHFATPELKQTVYASQRNLKTQKVMLADRTGTKELKMNYDDFYANSGNQYPKDININIRAEKNIDCKLRLSYFAFDKKKEINFAIPKSYKTTRL